MRIAVCIYGQPRFMEESAQFFKDEFFDFPGHTVDVFIHTWDRLGYTAECDSRENVQHLDCDKLRYDIYQAYGDDHLKGVRIDITDEAFLDEIESFVKVRNSIRGFTAVEYADKAVNGSLGRGRVMDNLATGRWIYNFGQHYSVSKVMQMKRDYEEENNFTYDLVVRTRADMIYPANIDKSYSQVKEEFYTARASQKGIQTHGLRLRILDPESPPFHLNHIELDKCGLRHIEYTTPNVINYFDDIYDCNGMPSFLFHLQCKDWVMYADSKTADTWINLHSTYLTYLFNSMIRYKGGKQVSYIVGGEIINGFHALIEKLSVYKCPRRCFRIVHLDNNLRKPWFEIDPGHQGFEKYKAAGVVIACSHDEMVQQLKDYKNEDCSVYTNKKLFGKN